MKLRFSQVKCFTALTAATLESAINTWLVATGGELVSVELVTQQQEDEDEIVRDFLVAMVVYTTE